MDPSEKSLVGFLCKLGLRDSLQDANASSDAKEAAANELTEDLLWRADAGEKSDIPNFTTPLFIIIVII